MATVGAIGKNKVVVIKTADRAFGTPSNFGVNLASYNLKPAYVSYHQVAMPNGFYNITTSSNTLSMTLRNVTTPTPLSVTIPAGTYNATTLLSGNTAQGGTFVGLLASLNTAANVAAAVGPTFFQMNAEPTTGYYTISKVPGNVNWTFEINLIQSLDWILGFRLSQATNFVPGPYIANLGAPPTGGTGVVILDLRSPPNVYIRSSLVTGNYLSGAGSESILAIIQNAAVFGQTIFQKNPEPELDIFPLSGQVSQATFQLVDEYGHELKMDTNQDWELSIGFYTP